MQNTAARKLRQVPEGYLIVGIDPHKKRHAAVAITQDLTTHDRFKLDNTKEGLEFMLRRVRTEMVKSDCRGVMFAIETGGHYWRNVAYFLNERGVPFRFINQYTLKRRREGKDLNRRKNDFRDSEVAAQLLCTGEFVESSIPQGVYAELRAAQNCLSPTGQGKDQDNQSDERTIGWYLPGVRPCLQRPMYSNSPLCPILLFHPECNRQDDIG